MADVPRPGRKSRAATPSWLATGPIQRRERRRVRWFFAGLLAMIGGIDVVEAFVVHHRLRDQALSNLLPTSVTDGSRTAVVVAGLLLLLLARGMARGKRVAWFLTCVVLAGSAVLHLIKDLDFEQALLAAWVLLGLWWLRPVFQAASDPVALRRGAATLAAGIGLALLEAEAGSLLLRNELRPAVGIRRSLEQIVLAWLGGSVYVPLSERARWFLGSLPWVSGVLLVIGLIQLLRPVAARGGATAAELDRARALARRWGHNPICWLALSPQNSFCWVDQRSVVAYRVSGKVAIALGDPIGPESLAPQAINAFSELCERRDWTPGFYQVETAELYQQMSRVVLPIGSDAIVEVGSFSLEGPERAQLRYAVRRCERELVAFTFQPGAEAWELAAEELREVSSSWMIPERGPELGFSLGRLESLDDPEVMAAIARDRGGRVVAFVSWLPVPRRHGWTLDLMRRRRDAPYGVIEALIVHSIAEARSRNLSEVSLGLAVDLDVSGVRPPAHLRALYRWLGGSGRLQSLRRFKDKFGPRWEPRYLVVNDVGALPVVLAGLGRVHLPAWSWVLWLAVWLRHRLGRWLRKRAVTPGRAGGRSGVAGRPGPATPPA